MFVSIISRNLSSFELTPDTYLSKEYQKPKHLLGFLSNNRVEYVLLEIACMATNIVTVGLLDKIEIFAKMAKQLNLKYLFCLNTYLEDILVLQNQGKVNLKLIIVLHPVTPLLAQSFADANIKIIEFDRLIEGPPRASHGIESNDPYCLSPTSGTTDEIKYCIITHLNIMSTLSSCLYLSQNISTEDSYLSYINFSLLGEKMFFFIISASGGRIGLSSNPTDFRIDAVHLKPTILVVFPRILDYLYKIIKNEVETLTGVSKSLYNKAYSAKYKQYEKNGELKHKIWDNLVFKKIRNSLGGKLKIIIAGSGLCNRDVVRYLRIVLGCYILEGYGLMEATGCSLCTYPDDINCGYVGGPIINLEVRLNFTDLCLEDCGGFFGELCLKGDSVSGKYYGVSGSCLDKDGWLHTGDLFALVPENGGLRYIDRVDYVSRSRSGQCICIQKLEILYRQCKYVAQILIVGSSIIEGVIAIIVPDEDYVLDKWRETDIGGLCNDPNFSYVLLREFSVIEKINKLKDHEKILKVHIELHPWTSDELITPTLKIKRHKLLEKYENDIQIMFEELARSS